VRVIFTVMLFFGHIDVDIRSSLINFILYFLPMYFNVTVPQTLHAMPKPHRERNCYKSVSKMAT